MVQLHLMEDKDLVGLYQAGDQNAITEIILRYKQRIFTSIFFLVKDRELAEDLFQETFIKIITSLRKNHYNEQGKFLPWALRISHNLVIDHFRKQKRMPMVRDTEDYSVMDSLKLTDENIEDRIITSQIHDTIRQLVDFLPLDQREVVVMRHFADMSFKEIAECTNVSINTSLGRMRYALINLRKLIKEKQLVLAK